MDPLWMIVVAAIAAAGVFWWMRRRATPPPAEDEWQLPPESGSALPRPAPEPQVLDRNTVLGGKRAFDPSGWDDTPDGEPAAEPEPGELPKFFDRDYLEKKKRDDQPER